MCVNEILASAILLISRRKTAHGARVRKIFTTSLIPLVSVMVPSAVGGIEGPGLLAEQFSHRTNLERGPLQTRTLINRLIRERKIDVSTIRGKWEATLTQVVEHPLPGWSVRW